MNERGEGRGGERCDGVALRRPAACLPICIEVSARPCVCPCVCLCTRSTVPIVVGASYTLRTHADVIYAERSRNSYRTQFARASHSESETDRSLSF